MAIKYTLDWVIGNKPDQTAILSDSLSAIQSIKNRDSKSRPDLVNSILALNDQCLANNLNVTLIWVPAHVGLVGNEVADRLAKGGLGRDAVDDEVGLAPSEVQAISRRHIMEEWRRGMAPAKNHNYYTRTSVSLNPPEPYSTNHRVERCITRLRLGTTLLPASHGKYILGVEAGCALCGTPCDTAHVLLHCPSFGQQRADLRAAIAGQGLSMNIDNLLNPSKAARGSVFLALGRFILDCQITDKI